MKKLFKILLLTVLLTSIVSCEEDEKSPTVTYKAVLNGASESTANTSKATGLATLTFNTTTKIFTMTVDHTVVSPTGGHIHRGVFKVNGPVIFPLATLASPIMYTSAALTTEQEADLTAGLYYVNLHTAAFPGGEIRGNLSKQ